MSTVMKVRIIGPFDEKVDVGIDCTKDEAGNPLASMTKQSFKDECDINVLMARYERTGVLDWVNEHEPQFADVSNAVDFQAALNTVIVAQDLFDSMPGDLRKRFANDPVEFLKFMDDPANVDESIKLGLRTPPPAVVDPTPVKVEIVSPTPVISSPAPS